MTTPILLELGQYRNRNYIEVDHPPQWQAGDPVRYGQKVGIALIPPPVTHHGGLPLNIPPDPGRGNYERTERTTQISPDMAHRKVPIRAIGKNANNGDEVHYHDQAVEGVHLQVNGDPETRNAFAGWLQETTILADTTNPKAQLQLDYRTDSSNS